MVAILLLYTTKTKGRGWKFEPFLIEINDKSKLIYTKILILITWMDKAHIFLFFMKSLVQFFKNVRTIWGPNV